MKTLLDVKLDMLRQENKHLNMAKYSEDQEQWKREEAAYLEEANERLRKELNKEKDACLKTIEELAKKAGFTIKEQT